jgi:potassium-transporting ATPase ATP-binding subunit
MAAQNAKQLSLFDPAIVRQAVFASLRKLDPRLVAKNPVMFVVEVGSLLTTLLWLRDRLLHPAGAAPGWFTLTVSIWLWFTVIFANFAEAVAEGRGKAQADALRRMRREIMARKLVGGREVSVEASALRKGDMVVIEAGQMVPGDGEITEGIASVDESAITGESARSSGSRAATARP